MQVRAIAPGVYGRYYEAGQEFEIIDDSHLGSWMVPIDPKECERLKAKLDSFARQKRPKADPKTPATTALLKEIPKPAVRKSEAKK